jgi:hypothetical protein
MATSDSLERRKEQKPESVHFWLAIVAGSLFFHSVFMFGVSRAVKVAVVEPGGGAIDVEFVEASGSKAAPEGEPIVPASSFKPEPFRPELTPLPEFSPEPTPKPSPEVVQKPEVKETPIVPPPNPTNRPKTPAKTAPRTTPEKGGTPARSSQPLTKPEDLTGVRSVIVSYEEQPEQESSNSGDASKPDEPAKLILGSFPNISINANSPLLPGSITVQFYATCPISTGNRCDPSQVKLSRNQQISASYSGSASTISTKDQEDIDRLATEIVSKASVQSLTTKTSFNKKAEATYWSITFTLR